MSASKKLTSTLANAATGSGATYAEDVFSTYLYEGNGSSQTIENGINLGQSYGSGSVEFDGVSDYISLPNSDTLSMGTGDFTIEFWVYSLKSARDTYFLRMLKLAPDGSSSIQLGHILTSAESTGAISYYAATGTAITGTTDIRNAWHHIALVRNSGTVTLYVDGTSEGTPITDTANKTYTSPFIGSYSGSQGDFQGYISDLRIVKGTAVYTSTFTPPTSELTAVSGTSLLCLQGDEPFTDNSSNSHTLTQNGNPTAKSFGPFDAAEEGEGGLVWTKGRSYSLSAHILTDTERGYDKTLYSYSSSAEGTNTTRVTSFNANGFSLGSNGAVNTNGEDYASWTFRKAPGFFDVVTYTGTGSATTISHNLGSVPGCIFIKCTSNSYNWAVWHRATSNPANDYLTLNDTVGAGSSSAYWDSTEPTSTDFTIGSVAPVNISGQTYVAYLFAHNDDDGEFGESGDQDIIKCGSYTGDGTTNFSNSVNLGFEPQWLLIKRTDAAQAWFLLDNMRGLGRGTGGVYLSPNDADADAALNIVGLDPTGFSLGSVASVNTSGANYIYIAIRRPHKPATSGTEVFDLTTHFGTGLGNTGDEANGVKVTSGVIPDLVIAKLINGTSQHRWWSRLTGHNVSLASGNTDAEYSGIEDVYFDHSDGWVDSYFGDAGSSNESVNWGFKRAPGFFDVVTYEGDGTSPRTYNHNLGVTPELIITKGRQQPSVGNANWEVWHKSFNDLGSGYSILLESTAAVANRGRYNGTSINSSTVSVTSDADVNESGINYIAYLFASQDGISKVGSYTGDGTNDGSKIIDCGFSTGARFVLIKRTDSTGDWQLFDTERGITTGDDYILRLNSTNPQGQTNAIDPDSSGFKMGAQSSSTVNASGATYIFLAIA